MSVAISSPGQIVSMAPRPILPRTVWIWSLFILPLTVFATLTYVVPLLGILVWSLTKPSPGLGNYAVLVDDASIQLIFWRTLRICTLTAVTSVILAYLLAAQWVFGPPLRRKLIGLAVLIPFWISSLIRAFGWLALLRPKGLINDGLMSVGLISDPLPLVRNEFGVIVGMVHFMVPFAVFPLLSVIRQIDVRLLQAARGLGAGPLRRFFTIFLPLTTPGLVAAFFIVFVFGLGFFITPAILGGGRVVMTAEFVYTQMFQTANWGLGSALASVLLGFVISLIWLASRLVDLKRFAR